MPPAVVYQDLDASADASGGLFAGKKFFLVQRIPLRSHFISLVQDNGGRVVKIEQQADYLIADHARKDNPPGFISYKFIEDAVKDDSVLGDPTAYAIGPQRTVPRPTGSSANQNKSTRTRFTAEDDKELYVWVKTAEEKGVSVKGNELYKQLEEKNNRHTFHSWRDRYLKTLANKPPTGLSLDNLDSHAHAYVLSPSTAPAASASRPRNRPIANTPATRVPFTPEDDDVIRQWAKSAIAKGQYLRGTEIWKQLEKQNTRHTWQSWKDRWVKYLDDEDDDVEDDVDDAGDAVDDAPPLAPSPPRPSASNQVKSSSACVPTPTAVPSVSTATAKPPSPVENGQHSPSTRTQHPATEKPTPTPTSRGQIKKSSPIPSPPSPAEAPAPDPEPDPDISTFTNEDFETLLHASLDIQNIRVGRYHEAWVAWATENSQHTAEEWRYYYETTVLPVALEKEGDDSLVRKRGTKKNRRFWRSQGQPIPSLPSMRLSEATEYSRPQPETPSKEPVEEDAVAAEVSAEKPQTRREPQLDPQPQHRPEPGFQSETQPRIPANYSPSDPSKRKIQGDDRDQAQKRRRVDDSAQNPAASSPLPSQDHEIINISSNVSSEDESMDEDSPARQIRREMELSRTRPQLTEANLAQAQAIHDQPPTNRGIDLAEDDEDKDQDDFVNYLERLLPEVKPVATAENANKDDEGYLDQEGIEATQLPVPLLVDVEMIDPNLEYDPNMGYSSPIRGPPVEHPAPLDPDRSPLPAPSDHDGEALEYSEDIQLDIPEPPGGFDFSSQNSGNRVVNGSKSQNTQDILAQATQPLDLDIPSPSSISQEPSPSDSSVLDSQTFADDEIEGFIKEQNEVFGHDVDDIVTAIKRSSSNKKLALLVLQSEQLPDVKGVWSEEEDDIVEDGNRKAMWRLEEKHGEGTVLRRLEFLMRWREDLEDDEDDEDEEEEEG